MVVIFKATALGALCIYAAVGGIDLLRGGREVEIGWAVVYARSQQLPASPSVWCSGEVPVRVTGRPRDGSCSL